MVGKCGFDSHAGNDTTFGKFTLGDITISKPEDLDKNFQLGTLIMVSGSEWFLTTNSYDRIWQNYSQGVVLDSEGSTQPFEIIYE